MLYGLKNIKSKYRRQKKKIKEYENLMAANYMESYNS